MVCHYWLSTGTSFSIIKGASSSQPRTLFYVMFNLKLFRFQTMRFPSSATPTSSRRWHSTSRHRGSSVNLFSWRVGNMYAIVSGTVYEWHTWGKVGVIPAAYTFTYNNSWNLATYSYYIQSLLLFYAHDPSMYSLLFHFNTIMSSDYLPRNYVKLASFVAVSIRKIYRAQ